MNTTLEDGFQLFKFFAGHVRHYKYYMDEYVFSAKHFQANIEMEIVNNTFHYSFYSLFED